MCCTEPYWSIVTAVAFTLVPRHYPKSSAKFWRAVRFDCYKLGVIRMPGVVRYGRFRKPPGTVVCGEACSIHIGTRAAIKRRLCRRGRILPGQHMSLQNYVSLGAAELGHMAPVHLSANTNLRECEPLTKRCQEVINR